jgi:predicted small secreted protein
MKKITVFLLVAVLLGGLSLVVIGEDIQRGGNPSLAVAEVGGQ